MTRLCTDVLVVSTGTSEKQANLPRKTMIIGNMVARSYTYAGALPVPCISDGHRRPQLQKLRDSGPRNHEHNANVRSGCLPLIQAVPDPARFHGSSSCTRLTA